MARNNRTLFTDYFNKADEKKESFYVAPTGSSRNKYIKEVAWLLKAESMDTRCVLNSIK